jgi:ribosome recycling factor
MIIEEVNQYQIEVKKGMDHALEHLQHELLKIRTGKANSSLVQSVYVEYYGSTVPISQVANVSASDSRTLILQPWEKKMLSTIEKAIFEANLGVTPQNDGEIIRLVIPPLTEERRKEMVKVAKHLGEDAKVSIRNWRHKAMDFFKKAVKNGIPEDVCKRREDEVQLFTNQHVEKVDKIIEQKEHEILTV